MMAIDSDIQLWLEAQHQFGQTVITPYIKSAGTERLQYQMEVFLKTSSGTSTTKQSGQVELTTSQPTAMGHVALQFTAEDTCFIRIRLQNGKELSGDYTFTCPLK